LEAAAEVGVVVRDNTVVVVLEGKATSAFNAAHQKLDWDRGTS
jgi:hypothetical protein